ncbi:MAG: hypothetical protein KDJ75_03300 [Alphaproteobacteria bacterium]|nr:hypothetical protein [Alphaproteobacteria bacterium]
MALKNNAAKRRKKGKAQLILIGGALMAAAFLPVTLFLTIALLPALTVIVLDPAKRKTKSITVGALNLAGASPFLLDLWAQGHDFEAAISAITDPFAITVIYTAAAAGYLIDWSMTGIIAAFLYQKGLARKKTIKERQAALVERWGEGVTGNIPLDEYGFPLSPPSSSPD